MRVFAGRGPRCLGLRPRAFEVVRVRASGGVGFPSSERFEGRDLAEELRSDDRCVVR